MRGGWSRLEPLLRLMSGPQPLGWTLLRAQVPQDLPEYSRRGGGAGLSVWPSRGGPLPCCVSLND